MVTRRHRSRRMHAGFWAVCLLMTLCAPSVVAQSNVWDTSHWEGMEVFNSKGCAHCHSVSGKKDKEGPDLRDRKFKGTYLELASRMWNHFPRMYKTMQESGEEFHSIDAREMAQLITYLSFIRYVGDPGDTYKGRKILTKRCGPCHSFDGIGGDIGPDFVEDNEYMSATQLIESMWNHGPEMLPVFEEHGVKRPVFKGRDIDHVLAGIRSYAPRDRIPPGTFGMGDPANGEMIFRQKGCIKCHAVRGEGGTLGPGIDRIDLDCSAPQLAGRMWNHGPKMWEIMQRENISIPSFEQGEMADVISYLYAVKLEDPPGDPEKGQRIIEGRGCLNCHSWQGRGGDVSVDLSSIEGLDSAPAMVAAMWNHAPGMREKQLEQKVKWPKIKRGEMADLYACLIQTSD